MVIDLKGCLFATTNDWTGEGITSSFMDKDWESLQMIQRMFKQFIELNIPEIIIPNDNKSSQTYINYRSLNLSLNEAVCVSMKTDTTIH